MTANSAAAAAFASVLRAEAGRRGLNQTDVAARSGIHTNTVRHYWHGRRVPALEAVFAIEEALDMEPGQLVALAYAERNAALGKSVPIEYVDRADVDPEDIALAASDADDDPEVEAWQDEA